MLKKNLIVRHSSPAPAVLAATSVAFFASRTVLASESPSPTSRGSVHGVCFVIIALTLGCGAPSTHAPFASSPASTPSLVSLAPLTAASLTLEHVPSQSLSLRLPEANLWRSGSDGTYYHATHVETASDLWIKRWRQGQVVSAAECAAQSALWRPELAVPNVEQLKTPSASLVIHAPPDYHTQVNVTVWADGANWQAQLTASGASLRECFSYVYRTRAPRSPLGRAVVSQRLKVMRDSLAETRVTGATTDDVRDPTR